MNKHIKIITIQIIFLALIVFALYFIYPKTTINVSGETLNIKTINGNVVAISEDKEFSSPRYFEVSKNKGILVDLPPGKYYIQSSNGVLKGLKKEIVIDSEVGMNINRKENDSELVNIGNVKINITKNKDGGITGHVVLEPDQIEKIEEQLNESYVGRQEWKIKF